MTNSTHFHFRSSSELAEWFEKKRSLNGPLNGYGSNTSRSRRHGSSDTLTSDQRKANEGVSDLRNGTLENLDKAQEIVDQISVDVQTQRSTWEMDIVGAFPDVPAYLAGVPENMWNQVPDMSDKSPLVVWIGLTSEGGIPPDTLINRGATIAAFVLAMVNIRPVTLRPFVALGGYISRRGYTHPEDVPEDDRNIDENLPDDGQRAIILSWDIQTSPLVLAELMTIARPEVTRYFGIEACQQAYGRVAKDDTRFHPSSMIEKDMRRDLGIEPGHLYMPQITRADPWTNDPVTWVQENVAKFSEALAAGDDSGATDFADDRTIEAYRRGYYE